MIKRFNFTQAKIKALPAPEKGRVDYYDEKVKKLSCQVSSTCNKFFVVVRYVNDNAQRITLKTINVVEARNLALATLTASIQVLILTLKNANKKRADNPC